MYKHNDIDNKIARASMRIISCRHRLRYNGLASIGEEGWAERFGNISSLPLQLSCSLCYRKYTANNAHGGYILNHGL